MTSRYVEIEPDAALGGAVDCLWTFEGADPEPQAIAPDGCCELIVHWGTPYEEETPDGWRLQPTALFAGQLTRPLRLRAPNPAGVTAVRFRPAGAGAFVGGPMDALTDRRAPLAGIVGEDRAGLLVAEVRAAGGDEGRFAAVQAFVDERIGGSGRRPDASVERCVEAIAASEGRIAVEALERLAGLGARQLQRRFAAEVGLPPRLLASIVRFRRVFTALQDADTRNWTAAAQAAGYFDHPQMARDFRRFLGCTPSQFVAARVGLAASLVDLPAS